RKHSGLQEKLDNCYLDKIEGRINTGFWQKQHENWITEQNAISLQIQRLETANTDYYQEGVEFLELAQGIYSHYVRQTTEEQGKLLRKLLSNCTIKDLTLYPTYTKPFNLLVEGSGSDFWLAIRDMCPLIKAVSPEKKAYRNVAKYMDREIRSPDDFRGCWPEQAIVTNRDVSNGRFIDDNDMRRASKVCVIGPAVADALFDHREDAIGKEIKVNGYAFNVIGVQEEIDDFFGISENDFIYIPMTTFDQYYPNTNQVYLLASAISRDMFGEAMDQIVNALRRVRKLRPEDPNNFGFQTQERFKNMINDIVGTVHMVAVAVACVGLLVGVIGVLNIMLISVTQRTREIGIRKALGARRKNILFQFLVEAGTLTGVGGLIGIFFGALVGLVITASLDWHYHLSFIWTFAGLAVSIGTGMTAGVYPAWRASRVDPIIALRYE
ncbi:MAG: ABC transporter permease, partial [Candidatus Zixiibacteriota bacterium]